MLVTSNLGPKLIEKSVFCAKILDCPSGVMARKQLKKNPWTTLLISAVQSLETLYIPPPRLVQGAT